MRMHVRMPRSSRAEATNRYSRVPLPRLPLCALHTALAAISELYMEAGSLSNLSQAAQEALGRQSPSGSSVHSARSAKRAGKSAECGDGSGTNRSSKRVGSGGNDTNRSSRMKNRRRESAREMKELLAPPAQRARDLAALPIGCSNLLASLSQDTAAGGDGGQPPQWAGIHSPSSSRPSSVLSAGGSSSSESCGCGRGTPGSRALQTGASSSAQQQTSPLHQTSPENVRDFLARQKALATSTLRTLDQGHVGGVPRDSSMALLNNRRRREEVAATVMKRSQTLAATMLKNHEMNSRAKPGLAPPR